MSAWPPFLTLPVPSVLPSCLGQLSVWPLRGTASEGAGLGADGQEHPEDSFDVFRQRMMQMYRHKRANK